MTESERRQIIELIKKEVIPAIGCTEPIAVALCVAKAAETLGVKPEKIDVLLSANILKNAMGVGIPGTGMVGLPIAVALGALIGKSDYQLEVLRDCTPEAVEQGKRFIAEKRICISLLAHFWQSPVPPAPDDHYEQCKTHVLPPRLHLPHGESDNSI